MNRITKIDVPWYEGLIEQWGDVYDSEFLYEPAQEQFYQYKNGVYRPIFTVELRGFVRDFLRQRNIKTSNSKVAEWMRELEENYIVFLNDFDQARHLINFTNGVYDMNTKKLLPHSPEMRQTIQFNVEFIEEECETPFFDEFRGNYPLTFFQIEQYIQSILHRDLSHEQMLNLLGPTRSGKGTITNIIQHIFLPVLKNDDIHNLKGDFGMARLLNCLIFLDKEMTIKGFDASTIRICKTLTGGDTRMGVTVNKKGVNPFSTPLEVFIITAANQFGELPYGVSHEAWYSRTNIKMLDKSFPSNPLFKDGIMNEINIWVSELLKMPYHNWTIGMDKAKDWVPAQQKIWEESANIYKKIAREHFTKTENYTLVQLEVVDFFRQMMERERHEIPNIQKMKTKITSVFQEMGCKQSRKGRDAIQLYYGLGPKKVEFFKQIVGDMEEDEEEPCNPFEEQAIYKHEAAIDNIIDFEIVNKDVR